MTPSNDDRSGPYELLGPLGQDALVSAFMARRLGGGGLVRLELLHPELIRNDLFRARFLDQAAAMLSLSHPVLPQVLEVLSEVDARGVALELVPGRSLTEVLQRTGRARCPVDLHVYWLRQVLSGLEHAHQASAAGSARGGFVHGDVCPSRVQLGYAGEVQLLGSGFAACRHALAVERGRPVADVRYAAPEVLLGEPAGPSADLYSLGAMLWEAVARQARTIDTDLMSVSRRRTLGSEPDLESAWPDAPDALVRLCARALALHPHDRYWSAAEMAADLDAYLYRAAEPSAILAARVPGWMEATFGAREERWPQRSAPPSSRNGEPVLSRRRTLSAFPPPAPTLDAGRRAPEPAPLAETLAPASDVPSARPESVVESVVPPLSEPAQRPSDTGGHRAFTSTWISSPPGARTAWPAARAALPALAVAVGAIIAVWVVIAQRSSAGHGSTLAAAPPAQPLLAHERSPAPASTRDRPARASADAGVERSSTRAVAARAVATRAVASPAAAPRVAVAPLLAAPPAAFLAGRVPFAAQRADQQAPLAADELPQVDDARDSLQAAIVRAARAQRRTRPRRAKPPAPLGAATVSAASSEGVAPWPIDTRDPYPSGADP